jgi:tetratricopeptide (TPR) repeat protein
VLRASGHRSLAAFAEMHRGRLRAAAGDAPGAVESLLGVRDQFAAMGLGASVYETSLYVADCLTQAGRPADALETLAGAVNATNDDVSIFDAARARFAAEALIAMGRFDDAAGELVAGIRSARARGLEYELGLLLQAVAAMPFPIPTGSDEPAADEAARLFTRLGVVARPEAVGTDASR